MTSRSIRLKDEMNSASKQLRLSLLAFTTMFALSMVCVADVTPAGTWTTFDDVTGKPSGIIEITEVGGTLQGRIVSIVTQAGEDPDPDPKCSECAGDRNNQAIKGMTVLWGLTRHNTEYSGGEILDPDEGKIYRCLLRLSDDGDRLEVRGYVGLSLFGRTQVWRRTKMGEPVQKAKATPK